MKKIANDQQQDGCDVDGKQVDLVTRFFLMVGREAKWERRTPAVVALTSI